MKTEPHFENLSELAEAWTTLQRYAPLRTIKNEEEFERTCALGDLLAEAVGDESSHPLYSLFQLVMDLIKQWEDQHLQLPDPLPHELLAFLLEANDLQPQDLTEVAPESLLNEILAGRREITADLASRLAERFHIAATAFL